jgi:hypothetical protein
MPADGHHGRNMQQVLTKLIKFVVVDGNTYVSFSMVSHNGINFTKKGNILRKQYQPARRSSVGWSRGRWEES